VEAVVEVLVAVMILYQHQMLVALVAAAAVLATINFCHLM